MESVIRKFWPSGNFEQLPPKNGATVANNFWPLGLTFDAESEYKKIRFRRSLECPYPETVWWLHIITLKSRLSLTKKKLIDCWFGRKKIWSMMNQIMEYVNRFVTQFSLWNESFFWLGFSFLSEFFLSNLRIFWNLIWNVFGVFAFFWVSLNKNGENFIEN